MTTPLDPLEPPRRAEPPLIPRLFGEGWHLPSPEEIFLRQVHGWGVARIATLSAFSYYGRRTIEEYLPGMVEKGLLRSLGSPQRGRLKHVNVSVNENLYSIGPARLDRRPYGFSSRIRLEPCTAKSLHETSGVVTRGGLRIPSHYFYVPEVAAWVARGMHGGSNPCLVYPERVLRGEFGWYFDKKQEKKWFFTPVPDAWLILGGHSLRLEVQLSQTKNEKVQDVCKGAPLNEPVLYVVLDEDLYTQFHPLLDKIPHFFLARYQNPGDLKAVESRLYKLISEGGIKPSEMRDHYAGLGFAQAHMKAEAADIFTQHYAKMTVQLQMHAR